MFRQAAFLIVMSTSLGIASAAAPKVLPADAETVNRFVQTYCLDCHQADDPEGGMNLEAFDAGLATTTEAWDTTPWERMLKRLRGRQMPPPAAERPSEEEYQQAILAMEQMLDQVAAKSPFTGRTETIRRLNRTEYGNAIRDLLGLRINVKELLPADQSGHGFDNVTVSKLSPVLLNRYLDAAQQISRRVVGSQSHRPEGLVVRLPADRTQEHHVEGLPLGTKGGTLIEHHFTHAGEYEIRLRLTRDRDEHVEGLGEPHDVHIMVDKALVHSFTVEPPPGQGENSDHSHVDDHLYGKLKLTAGTHKIGVAFPSKGASLATIKRQPFDASFNRHRHPRRSPALFEVSIIGPLGKEAQRQDKSQASSAINPLFAKLLDQSDRQSSAAAIESDKSDQAERVLRRLMRKAYRRPIREADLAVPMQFFRSATIAGEAGGLQPGIESALSAVLVNPNFLLRVERDPADSPPGVSYQVTDLELASRLSFFLWSSLPDEPLLDVAEAGALHEPKVLREQVLRMLADPRSESLVSNFAAQWLYLNNLDSFQPDRRQFPDFDDNLRQAFREETEQHFRRILREDRSVLELIRSEDTFLNERLAKHYDIPQVVGSQFRAVEVSPESRRGGLLRQGSILAVTSYATRTSPTVRGNWILENIVGTPPPPPPPNIPSLEEKKTATGQQTVRQRLAVHRENPACASCHDRMDPVGFALENFDAVGRWREYDAELPIDASGALPDGSPASGIDELEAGILARPEMFVGTMVEKLLTFALGRGIDPREGPAIREIVRNAAKDDYRLSSILVGVATSPSFQMRMTD